VSDLALELALPSKPVQTSRLVARVGAFQVWEAVYGGNPPVYVVADSAGWINESWSSVAEALEATAFA
jgi:hypothetical protein